MNLIIVITECDYTLGLFTLWENPACSCELTGQCIILKTFTYVLLCFTLCMHGTWFSGHGLLIITYVPISYNIIYLYTFQIISIMPLQENSMFPNFIGLKNTRGGLVHYPIAIHYS